jgi:hypothetical protein
MTIDVEKEVKKFHKQCKSLGQTLMENHNEVPMTVAVLTQSKGMEFSIGVVPTVGFLYDTENKEPFVDAMKQVINLTKPVAIAFISEAWMVKKAKNDTYDFNIPVSKQEDRKEVLMVQIETYKDTSLTVYDIIRDGDDVSLELDMEETKISKENVGGMFSNMLKENYEQFHLSIEEQLKKSLN